MLTPAQKATQKPSTTSQLPIQGQSHLGSDLELMAE